MTGEAEGVEFEINTGDSAPVYRPRFMRSPDQLRILKEEITKMIELDVMEPVKRCRGWGLPAFLVKKKAEDARKREAVVAKKKADAVKNKAREREAKKAEAARRKILRKGHLAAQDKMKADIVKAKDKGNFAEAKKLKADLKQLIENQEKELKMLV